jgi:nucleoid-associated protein YgaU
MLLTDLNGPMPLQPRHAGSGRILRPVRFAALSILFLCFATFGATISRAQDQQEQSVAEAARQERARKQELQKHAKHVYTEEDLKHPHILTPEDRAQVEAKRNECSQKNNCSPSPAQNYPASRDANSQTNGKSLGEVARQFRKQKELQALKPKQTEPFHLPFETPALASPILPERPAIHPPAQPVVRSKTSWPKMPPDVFRRDPFSALPARPGLRRRIAPAAPKIPKRDATPGILVHPVQPSAPPAPAQPAAPVATVRPVRPQPAASFVATTAQKTVIVQSGDSLWKLAQQNLGRGKRWPELLAANPNIVDPNQIRAGAELSLPAAGVGPASVRNAGNNATSTIKVRKGDTLWTLAKTNLGRSSTWPCLAAANPSISDPNHIYENQELIVPAACTP